MYTHTYLGQGILGNGVPLEFHLWGDKMKIADSNIQMQAVSSKTTAASMTLKKVNILATRDFMSAKGLQIGQYLSLDKEASVELTDEAKKSKDAWFKEQQRNSQNNMKNQMRQMIRDSQGQTVHVSNAMMNRYKQSDFGDYRFNLLERLMQTILGKKFKLQDPAAFMSANQSKSVSVSSSVTNGSFSVNNYSQDSGGGNVIMASLEFRQFSMEYYERENVGFSAQGNVTTEDGRSINFSMALNMTRELYERLDVSSLSVGVLCDPLVINFDTAFAQLSDKKIEFDLDCDGKSDQISTLLKGSGFLAIDDGSGQVKDGSQLFGAQSGNGFADLAKYDTDGNGWIDENDKIWDKLRIWVHDDGGNSKLIGLGEVGVGAIYLGNLETAFTLTGESGDTNGMVQRTGIFLREDGSVGTVQHVDLKI